MLLSYQMNVICVRFFLRLYTLRHKGFEFFFWLFIVILDHSSFMQRMIFFSFPCLYNLGANMFNEV